MTSELIRLLFFLSPIHGRRKDLSAIATLCKWDAKRAKDEQDGGIEREAEEGESES